MGIPTIKSGKLVCGADCEFGENVVINVAEEVVLGDRCVIGDNAYLDGRSVTIGDDFFGYSWDWRRLDVGRGRRDDEDAVLTVGTRCTFHDNKIDLARRVTVGDDVGLSPEVWILTHGYWMSPLEGFPQRYAPVTVGPRSIVYSRSIVCPGCSVEHNVVVGANSVCSGRLACDAFWGGNPAKLVSGVFRPDRATRVSLWHAVMGEYQRSLTYRGIDAVLKTDHPRVWFGGVMIDTEAGACGRCEGDECPLSDDLRWFLFRHGLRVYSKRRFRKLGRQS